MKKLICCLATLAVAFGALSALTFVKANAETTPAFKGVSVSLNENIVLKFEVENYTTGYTLTFNYKNKDYVGEVKGGVAEFAYVTPQYLDEVVTATIYDGETKVDETKKSVKEYLYELIHAKKADYSKMPCEQFAAMKTLAVDMLNYGAAAQAKYLEKDTYTLVNADLTTEEAALATTFAAPDISAQATLSGEKAGYEWVSAGIRFDYNVSLYFVVKPLTENAVLKLKINDNEVIDKFIVENGNYKFRYENVNAVDFANKYTVKVLDEENKEIGQTLSYSVNTYVLNMHANAETGKITQAVYNYGVSATKYNTAKGEHVYEKAAFTPPAQLVYARGQELDLAGMSFKVKCSVCGEEKDVAYEAVLSTKTAPEQDEDTAVIYVTYKNLSESFTITLAGRDEVKTCWTGWGVPSDGAHTSSFFVKNADNGGVEDIKGFSVWENRCYDLTAGGKMRVYFYSEKANTARLSIRAGTDTNKKINEFFTFDVYKLATEGQSLSEVLPERIYVPDTARFNANWGKANAVYVGKFYTQVGWNVVEINFIKGGPIDIAAILLDHVQPTREEFVAGWDTWKTITECANSKTSFFLNDQQGFSAEKDYCRGFTAGGKMRFYVYSGAATDVVLSCRVATGAGTQQFNKALNVNVYRLTDVNQALSEANMSELTISDNVIFGKAGDYWHDYSKETVLGEISLAEGWTVIEFEVAKTKDWDFNFKSMIINYMK